MLRAQPYDLPSPAPLDTGEALAALRDGGSHHGLLIC